MPALVAAAPYDLCAALAYPRQTVVGVLYQEASMCGWGVCSAAYKLFRAGNVPWRDQSFCIASTINALGDLDFAVQEVTLLDTGVGASGASVNLGGTLTQGTADTNLANGGTFAGCNMQFAIVGLAFELLDVYQMTDATTRYMNRFLAPDATYRSVGQLLALESSNASLTVGDTGCTFDIGSLSGWPFFGGVRDGGLCGTGLIGLPLTFTPLLASYLIFNGNDDSCRSTMVIDFETHSQIANDAGGVPTSSTLSDGTTDLFDDTVRWKIKAYFFGYMVLIPVAAMCGIAGFGNTAQIA
jgi:hypothetical protein